MSEMGRCRECRFWLQLEGNIWGSCEAVAEGGRLIDMVQIDDGRSDGFMLTREDFGCVGFGAKP